MNLEIKKTDILEEIICKDHHILLVIECFGIPLDMGNLSLEEACCKLQIDLNTFLAISNLIHCHKWKKQLPDINIEEISLPCLIEYIKATHHYFKKYKLPLIRRNLIEAIDCADNHKISFALLRQFDIFCSEIEQHTLYEEKHILEHVGNMLKGIPVSPQISMIRLINQHTQHHQSILNKLDDLISLLLKYDKSCKKNLIMNDVLRELFSMKEDFDCHSYIEHHIFGETALLLEKECIQKQSYPESKSHTASKCQEQNSILSNREKEIITYVAKGYSNREIAKTLNISINTILTHRRNINKKLKIHSPTELTIHGVLLGIISINDIKS